VDWAGGGLVSTTEDLNRFLRAFVADDIFQNPKTKQLMLNWFNIGEAGIYYGLGVARINLSELGVSGLGDIYGHDGFAQSFMFYWPKQNGTISGTLNQAVTEKIQYLQLVVGIMNLLENQP
jgi:D-alanyl-D-alanine carboxypeptidase